MTALQDIIENNTNYVIEEVLRSLPQVHYEGFKVASLILYIDGCGNLRVDVLEGRTTVNSRSRIVVLAVEAKNLKLDKEGSLKDSTYYYSLVCASLAKFKSN